MDKNKKKNDEDISITYDAADWTLGGAETYTGTTTTSVTLDGIIDPYQMSFGFDEDKDLMEKYPALKDAYEHYINIKQMCESREREEDAD